jgi:hypothetical protein
MTGRALIIFSIFLMKKPNKSFWVAVSLVARPDARDFARALHTWVLFVAARSCCISLFVWVYILL